MSYAKSSDVPVNQQLTLSWDNISVTANKPLNLLDVLYKRQRQHVTILEHVSGYVEPGTLTALLGCSGAGKSTLLNILAKRNRRDLKVCGRVALNGVLVEELTVISKLAGYVQQTELLPDALTVKEHLTIRAQLLLSKTLTFKERLHRVNEVLIELGLQSCADVLIGGDLTDEKISGGERKRLTIACQLLDKPRVLLLDEPTSGLDAFNANMLILKLTNLARRGYTVLCAIHQCSSDVFRLFDRVIILADGRSVYHGPREEALEYFSNQGLVCPDHYNPADFYTSLLAVKPWREEESEIMIMQLAKIYQHSQEKQRVRHYIDGQYKRRNLAFDKETDIQDQSRRNYQACWLLQFYVLVKINLLRLKRLPQNKLILISTVILNAFMWSAIFFNIDAQYDQTHSRNSFGLIFFYVVQLTIGGTAPVLATIVNGYDFFRKDYKDCLYTPSAFYFATVTSEIMLSVGSAIVIVSTSYYLAGLNRNGVVFVSTFILLTASMITCTGYYAIFGLLFNNTIVATSLALPLSVIFVLAGGFYINLRTYPAYAELIHYLDWIPWTTEAISILQWQDIKHIDCEIEDPTICVSSGPEILHQRGFNEDNFWKNVYIICAQLIVYQMLAVSIILYRVRQNPH